MLKEFRDFAMKGNVLDMAIGVIIGGAFGKIVSSLVSDVLMPPLGLLLGKVDFSGVSKRVCLEHVSEIQPGEYVLVHAGFVTRWSHRRLGTLWPSALGRLSWKSRAVTQSTCHNPPP